jgi:hypothetical protein
MSTKIFFLLIFTLLVACDDRRQDLEREKGIIPISDSEHVLFLGSIPENFIHGNSIKKDPWRATISFNSNDIPQYSGQDFSVRVYLKHYPNNPERNDPLHNFFKYFIRKNEVPVSQVTIGDKNDFIDRNVLTIMIYKLDIDEKRTMKRILINNTDNAVFQHKYLPDPRFHSSKGFAEYQTSIKGVISARYFIIYHSEVSFKHSFFIHAKKFLEGFYF